jgi:hypothetical protein
MLYLSENVSVLLQLVTGEPPPNDTSNTVHFDEAPEQKKTYLIIKKLFGMKW